ncbi:MAG: hypothetical protein JJE09_05385 [Bacteroidia bacterium]|nr:hypothetical protein [Bacteroidia bacterium]
MKDYLHLIEGKRCVLWNILSVVLILINSFLAYGQKNEWDSLTNKFIEYRKNSLQEKLFIHTDRSFYIAGETIWFTVYYVDGHLHHPLDLSKVAYLEIVDNDKTVQIQTKIELNNGLGNGYLEIPSSLASGNYLLRTYTHWMMNFSPELYYHQPITIVNTFRSLPISKSIDAQPEYDIQFFPEGGTLLSGISNKVGFRVVNKEGKGIAFQGNISDEKGNTICNFSPLKFGIGSFSITPMPGVEYTATIKDNKDHIFKNKLPMVSTTGYHIDTSDSTETLIKIRVTCVGANSNPFMLIHTRQSIFIARELSLVNGTTKVFLNKAKLPDGVSHITLFDSNKQAVCERLIFKRPESELDLKISSDQKQYGKRNKITLNIETNTPEKLISNLSLSIYKNDSLQQFEIPLLQHYLWLTSDLKGIIESPSFYFLHNEQARQAADNLMLTHGWTRFNWVEVTTKVKPQNQYISECNGPIITGTIKSDSNKSNAGRTIFLSSPGKNSQFYPAVSDALGNFKFELKNFSGRKNIFLEAKAQQDTAFRYELDDPFSGIFASITLPSITISKERSHQLAQQSIAMQVNDTYHSDQNKKRNPYILRDSSSFYGTLDEQYLLDDYTRFPLMEEVMREYVKGVYIRKRDGKFVFKVPNTPTSHLFDEEPLILLDGVRIIDTDKIMSVNSLKIREIDVITRKYFLGSSTFSGIVSFSSYTGDMAGLTLGKELLYEYQGIQETKEFFSPRYEPHAALESKLPDVRTTLHWVPVLKFDGKQSIQLDFFSSDQAGNYQIMLQGITAQGQAGSAFGALTIMDKKP